MSDIYPAGFYPRSSTVPPKWTDEAGQPGIVQFNGLVYVKSNRHTGGTGKPNEEEVSGIRTWKLYNQAGQQAQIEKGFRFYWTHLHTVIPGYLGVPLVYDEDCYNHIGNYFIRATFIGTASENLFPTSTTSSDYRLLVAIPEGNYTSPASGIFTVWQQNYTQPLPTITANPGSNGWPSADPNTIPPTPYPPPSPVPPVDLVIDKYINCPHTVFVGKTYTGYVEKLEATGSWVSNGFGGYNYVLTPTTITQVPISHTVTQQDYIDWIEGTTPYPYPTQTFTVYGAEDYWVGWGNVVLTGVSPTANA
jgi:hypothetical protein